MDPQGGRNGPQLNLIIINCGVLTALVLKFSLWQFSRYRLTVHHLLRFGFCVWRVFLPLLCRETIQPKLFNSSSDKAFSSLFISNKAFSSLFISNKAFHHSLYPIKRFLLLTLYLVGRCAFSFHSLSLRHSYVCWCSLLSTSRYHAKRHGTHSRT